MTAKWHTHDAGFFTLDVPPGWVAQQPNTGTLLLQDSAAEIAMALVAVSKAPLAGTPKPAAAPRQATFIEAQTELQKWIDSQKNVLVRQAPRPITGAAYPTATTEGLQQIRSGIPWYKRLFRRSSLMLWRYWAVLNPHLLVLATCNGKPTAIEKQRQIIDRLIASIQLPKHDILIGRRFTDTVVSLARSWFPQTAVVVIDDAHLQFGSQNVSLVNLHRKYLASPDELPKQVRAFLTAVQGDMPASALAGSWAHAREKIMPLFLTRLAVNNSPVRIVNEEWINGLFITYVMEDSTATGTRERTITLDDLARWSVPPEDLHEQAMHNLVVHSHEHIMEGRKSEGYTMLGLANIDRHNATRILLPELHRKLREHLGSTFYAAMPTREVLLAFSISDDDVLTRVRQEIADDFARAPDGLSPKLFLVTPDGIAGDPADQEDFDL